MLSLDYLELPDPIILEQIQGRKLGTQFEESVTKRLRQLVRHHESWFSMLEAFSNVCGVLRYTQTPVTYDSVKMLVDIDEKDRLSILKIDHNQFKIFLNKVCLSFVISGT